MHIADLILSRKALHRIVRHLVLWIVYCTYFWIQSLAPRHFAEFRNGDTYYFAFLNLCCFAPVFIFSTYFSVYYLLPKTVIRKRYVLFLGGFLLLYAFGTFVNYFMAGIFLSHVNYSTPVEVNFEHQLEFGNYNTRWGMVIAIIAMGAKFSKSWYLQQRENLEIQKRKNRTEMQLQKARLHPSFLLRSLDTIYRQIREGSGEAPVIILNLSDLLSYSLYESGKRLVPLEIELEHLKNFIAVEQEGNSINLQIRIDSCANNRYIVPLILIKLLEDTIASAHRQEQEAGLTDVYVTEAHGHLSIKFFFHQVLQSPTAIDWDIPIEKARRRLLEYYSQSDFRIGVSEKEQRIVIELHLTLTDGLQEPDITPNAVAYDNV